MKNFTLSFLVCALFAMTFVHANLDNEDAKKGLIGYLQSFHVEETEAELNAIEFPELLDMAIAVLNRDKAAEQDPDEAATLQRHIDHYESVKAELAKRNRKSLVHHVESEEDFDNQVKNAGDKLVVADFYATWCGPCGNLARHLDDIAYKYESKALILKINSDEQSKLAYGRYDVFAMPTIMYFKNGQIVEKYADASHTRMEDTIERFLN